MLARLDNPMICTFFLSTPNHQTWQLCLQRSNRNLSLSMIRNGCRLTTQGSCAIINPKFLVGTEISGGASSNH